MVDASSDAMAYVVGHHARLREPATARLMRELLAEDYARFGYA